MSQLASQLAGLASLADTVNATARRERYRFDHFGRAGCQLLHEMLKQAGSNEADEIFVALVEHMAGHNFSTARRRRRIARLRADGGAHA